ncbi:MAG: hypothetical protein H0U63_01455 [Burkholderiales bacterium]|nr:hypothetical protein [Burkholderiales bacterium]
MLDLSPPKLLNKTSLPFRNARDCKAWLVGLPMTDVPHAHTIMVEAIDSLNLTELPGYERLKILELTRDKVAFLQESLVGTFASKPLPLPHLTLIAWQNAAALWEGMERGYRTCLRAAANEDAETAKYFALIAERCLSYTGLQIRNYSFVYKEAPARLTQNLHSLFHFAEKRGVAHVPVKDSIDGHRGVASPAQTYIRALLLNAAEPSMLHANQLAAVDDLLKKWAGKVVISRIPPENEAAALRCTDLIGDKGLCIPCGPPVQTETLIYLDLKSLSNSLRRRIRKLAKGVPWSELSLPPSFAHVAVSQLLAHIHRQWCEALVDETSEPPARGECDVVNGFEAFYQALTGHPFEAPRQTEDFSSLAADQMAVFGKVIQRSAAVLSNNAAPLGETWKLESAPSSVVQFRRPLASKIAVSLQQMIGYRQAGESGLKLAIVRGMRDQQDAGLLVDTVPLTRHFEAVILRVKDMAFSPGLRLRSSPAATVELLLAPGFFQPGRVMEVRADDIQMYRLTGVSQRGPNFDWVTCQPL